MKPVSNSCSECLSSEALRRYPLISARLLSDRVGGRWRFLFREGEQGDSMYVLEQGKAAVLKSWYGKDYLLQTLKEGDCFGEIHCPRSASVRAVEDCSANRISAADLHRVYAQDLKQFALIQMNMGWEVCRRLRDANERLFSAKMGVPETDGHVFLGA